MKSAQIFFSIIFCIALISCNRQSMLSRKIEKKQARLEYHDSSLILKRNAGVDFIAKGDEPEKWTLEMDYDKAYVFETISGIKVRCTPSTSESHLNPDFEVYKSKGANETMDISIYKSVCDSDEKQNVTTVFTSNKLYKGCGTYLLNNQLNNKWILSQIDNELLSENEFPLGIPNITIDLIKNKMYGYDGCNSISSQINPYGDRLKFSIITSTLKDCENIDDEKLKLNLLSNHLVEYRFRNGSLILYLIDDSRLVFKPAY